LQGDWSSDVCSSDLSGIFGRRVPILVAMTGQATPPELPPGLLQEYLAGMRTELATLAAIAERLAVAKNDRAALQALRRAAHQIRSEERRVGKECRCR